MNKWRPAWLSSALLAMAAAMFWFAAMRQSTPQVQTQAQPPSQLIGTWQNTAAPYKHTMHIAYSRPFYAVSLDLQTESCGGAVDGLATYDEAEQALVLQTPAADEEVCTIRIHIQGEHATILESSACLYHHGVACNFAGRLEKMPTYFVKPNAAARMDGLPAAVNF